MNNKRSQSKKLVLEFVSEKMKRNCEKFVGYGGGEGEREKDRLFSNVYLVNKFYIKREICVLW